MDMCANFAEHCMDFRISTGKFVREKVTLGVANKLNKRHKDPPGMRSMAKHSLEEHLGHDFFECFVLDLDKKVEEQRAEPESVVTREAQVEHNGTSEMVLAWQRSEIIQEERKGAPSGSSEEAMCWMSTTPGSVGEKAPSS